MSFRVTGLDPAPFQHLHALNDEALAAQGIERVRITEKPAAPCRISLDDAEIGEAVLLLSYEHQPANTPYRQQGPIFIRETNVRASTHDAMPPAMARRTLSLRAFDAQGSMVDADVCEGAAAPACIARFFENDAVAYIHAHYARRGCFAARIDRA